MAREISEYDDMIDVRDVIARIGELRDARDEAGSPEEWADENPDAAGELRSMESLLEECKGCGGDEQWQGAWYPVTLIRDSYFTEYARELVEDIGDLPHGLPGYIEIDWQATSRNIRMDYTAVEFNGVTYWTR